MSDGTKIEWTDATWNVVNGCSVVSPGCTNCYAMKQAHRFPVRQGLSRQSNGGMVWTGDVRFNDAVLLHPLRWRRPRKIFVCAHGDLFHEKVQDAWIDRVFAVMALAPQHVFQVLTKRPERMCEWALNPATPARVWAAVDDLIDDWDEGKIKCRLPVIDGNPKLPALAAHGAAWGGELPWPLRNVWKGTSVEDQTRADERIPILLDTPAAVRWLSCEPLLRPIELDRWLAIHKHWKSADRLPHAPGYPPYPKHWYEPQALVLAGYRKPLHWVVVGGESGPGARPMHPDWARSLRDQCAAAGVPFLFKQWGAWREAEPGDQFDTAKGRKNKPAAFIVKPDDGTVHCFLPENPNPRYRVMLEVGKGRAGRLLDGVQHDGYPA